MAIPCPSVLKPDFNLTRAKIKLFGKCKLLFLSHPNKINKQSENIAYTNIIYRYRNIHTKLCIHRH